MVLMDVSCWLWMLVGGNGCLRAAIDVCGCRCLAMDVGGDGVGGWL